VHVTRDNTWTVDAENGNPESVTILLVEDNRDHAELILRSMRENNVPGRIEHVSDGEAALRYLFRRGEYEDEAKSPRPNLVLLDLRLPRIDGLEVLREIKNAAELQQIPAVILTTSDAERDVARAYAHHANSYLVKPVDFDKFDGLMRDLGGYWLGWNRQPEDGQAS
jgi:CheY-like chemotaxis protein